jgi:hypothetical protein
MNFLSVFLFVFWSLGGAIFYVVYEAHVNRRLQRFVFLALCGPAVWLGRCFVHLLNLFYIITEGFRRWLFTP